MKKIYTKSSYVSYNGKEYYESYFWKNYFYLENPESEVFTFDKFDEFAEHPEFYLQKEKKWFKNEKYIIVQLARFSGPHQIIIEENQFKKITIVYMYKEVKNPTMKELYNNLSAEDFIQYLKDKEVPFQLNV